MSRVSKQLLRMIRDESVPLTKQIKHLNPREYDKILQALGSADVVMIGEASHGTEEFYQHRCEITKRLIQEKGFNIIAVEADWPDAYRVCRYVRGESNDKDANAALGDFRRFPRWMWRNTVIRDFTEWLKAWNSDKEYEKKVGFFGLDLYSLHSSRAAVIEYLEKVDPDAAKRAKFRYGCFDQYGEDTQRYGYSVGFGLSKGCQSEVIKQLMELNAKTAELMEQDPSIDNQDRIFYARVNAKVVKDAENYYRHMFEGGNVTWNIRDKHMCDTLDDLLKHYSNTLRPAKAVVWAHNSHVGDTKGRGREYNIGQLARERFTIGRTFNIGFTTYNGTVTAANEWDEPPHFMKVRDALSQSYEYILHQAAILEDEEAKEKARHDAQGGQHLQKHDYYLIFRSNTDPGLTVSKELRDELSSERLERAIGVIYRPDTERWSHYFDVNMPDQFDCVIHLDRTRALHPLEITPQWKKGADECDETYPFGL